MKEASGVEGVTDFKDGPSNVLRDDSRDVYNTYSTELYIDQTNDILDNYAVGNDAAPLFLYLALQSPHDPYEVPQTYEDMYPDVYFQGVPDLPKVSNFVSDQ